MDLASGDRLHRFEFPSSVVTGGEGVASITVDVDTSKCDDAYAYIPDLFYNRLYVYSMKQNRVWAFSHNYFRMDPLQVNTARKSFLVFQSNSICFDYVLRVILM